jgi:hypothetical protein
VYFSGLDDFINDGIERTRVNWLNVPAYSEGAICSFRLEFSPAENEFKYINVTYPITPGNTSYPTEEEQNKITIVGVYDLGRENPVELIYRKDWLEAGYSKDESLRSMMTIVATERVPGLPTSWRLDQYNTRYTVAPTDAFGYCIVK